MNSDMNEAQETVTVALLEIHQRLLEDGAAWRDDLPLGATRSTPTPRDTAPAPLRQTHEMNEWSGHMTPQTQPPQAPRRDVSWGRRLVASAAIVVVVGLLAALFATFARGRNEPRVASTPTTGTPAAWTEAPHLTNQPVPPIIAQSDPSVVYEAAVTGADGQHIFRRSDDAGATWHDLAVPNSILGAYTLGYLAVWVDPANAKNVMVTLSRQVPPEQNDRLCPTVRASVAFARQGDATPNTPTSGIGGCQLQYFSADGGAHWTDMRFPVNGSVSSGWGVSQRTLNLLQSQETRLYTAIHYRGESGLVRIFVSQDHGATWNLSDAGLYAADHNICDFVAAPDSTTLYATTGASECFQMITPQPITLWRSDDAGAHWGQIGQLPGVTGQVIGAFKPAGRADFTLYIAASDTKHGPGYASAWASEDGGREWKAAPDLGGTVYAGMFLSEPHDGSLIITQASPSSAVLQPYPETPTTQAASPSANKGSNTFRNWRPGQTNWRSIAQPIPPLPNNDYMGIFYTIESTTQNGRRTLWVVTSSSNATHDGTVYSVQVARLS